MAEAYYKKPSNLEILASVAITHLYEKKAADVTDQHTTEAMTHAESTEPKEGPMTWKTCEAYMGTWQHS